MSNTFGNGGWVQGLIDKSRGKRGIGSHYTSSATKQRRARDQTQAMVKDDPLYLKHTGNPASRGLLRSMKSKSGILKSKSDA
jgi:hypothetical protein